MPRLSKELIVSDYNSRDMNLSFGYTMNERYSLNDMDLAEEKDDNMALLRLLRDHAPEEKK
tara:strand:+ start:1225 stop:1407 length:183 start_codon:yes stop_codon:yes gene_type:complete